MSDELTILERVLPERIDLRLVVTDMDGTLLDGEGKLPARMGQVIGRMRAAGVALVPASGRQVANVRQTFGELLTDEPLIAENGTVAFLGGRELYRNTLGRDQVVGTVRAVRGLAGRGVDVGTVLATPGTAWVERHDARFLEQVGIYYHSVEEVEDLLDLDLGDVIKIAVHDFGEAETASYPVLAAANPDLQTVVSARHWTDLMAPDASKGMALEAVQRELGVGPQHTAVFGDFLNDLDLFDHATFGFAMANAHPRVRQAAPYTAPANTADGVLRTVEMLLDRTVR